MSHWQSGWRESLRSEARFSLSSTLRSPWLSPVTISSASFSKDITVLSIKNAPANGLNSGVCEKIVAKIRPAACGAVTYGLICQTALEFMTRNAGGCLSDVRLLGSSSGHILHGSLRNIRKRHLRGPYDLRSRSCLVKTQSAQLSGAFPLRESL